MRDKLRLKRVVNSATPDSDLNFTCAKPSTESQVQPSEKISSADNDGAGCNNINNIISSDLANASGGFHLGGTSTSDLQPKMTYEETKKRRLEQWHNISKTLLETAFLLNYPQSFSCSFCGEKEEAISRCLDCGPSVYFCYECLIECQTHSQPHLHTFEIFKGGTFVGYSLESPIWKKIDDHNCETKYTRSIAIIDDKGIQHRRTVEFCMCEAEPVTLLRWNLWASSPKSPELAFHTGLLHWLTALMLECHLPVKGFCEALKRRQSKHYRFYQEREIKALYKVLMRDTVEQYRHFQYQVRHPKSICEDMDDGTDCPTCFKMEPKIFSLDADFQLVRKASSGSFWNNQKHGGRFFINQDEVDTYLHSEIVKKSKNIGCSEFQASNNLRSKVKNKKLDETAVFGSVCRHEYPRLFFSLKQGERLDNAVFLIEKLLESGPPKLHITYDLACMLDKHLKNQQSHLLEKITLSVPIFHNYGHKMSCQSLYNPRRTIGLGLTDGEGIERLWSYLGGFSKITKEMTPENRTDLLVDALVHYGTKQREKLGDHLIGKLERAKTLLKESHVLFENLQKSESGVSMEAARQWDIEEKQRFRSLSSCSNVFQLTKEEEYAVELNKQRIYNSQNHDADGEQEKRKRCLASLERALRITKRWTLTSDVFQMRLAAAQVKKQKFHLEKLRRLVDERSFLLELMKKCAKGQNVAIRLGKNIKRVHAEFEKEKGRYNEVEGPNDPLPNQIDASISTISLQC